MIRYADMRYIGQEHSVKAEFPGGPVDDAAIARAAEAFHAAHEREYGFRLDSPGRAGELPRRGAARGGQAGAAHHRRDRRRRRARYAGHRRVDFAEQGVHESPVYLREKLPAGARLAGPAIVEEPATTIVVPPGDSARVDEYGNIHITIEQEGRPG